MTITLTAVNGNTDFFSTLVNLTNSLRDALALNIITANTAALGSATTGNSFLLGIFAASNLACDIIRGGNVQTSNLLTIASNAQMNNSFSFIAGNVVINSTTIICGANNVVNTTTHKIGNSSVFTTINSTAALIPLLLANVVANDSFTVNNFLFVNQTATVGNSTVNVVANSSSLKINNGVETDTAVTTTGTGVTVIDSFLVASFRACEYFVSIKDNAANNYEVTKLLMLYDGSLATITEYATIYSNTVGMGVFTASTNSTAAILSWQPTSANTTVKARKTLLNI